MVFSQRIFVGKQRTFTIFLGTIHVSHRESKLGLEQLKNWVFAWIPEKFDFERKRVCPHTDPWSQRLVVQINQKSITGVENPSNSYIISTNIWKSCPVPHSSQISYWAYWDCYGSFDEQRLFCVKFARFRNFFDFAQIWGILESDKLWEIQCWWVADGKDESW